MDVYKLNDHQYARLIRSCTLLSDEYAHEGTFEVLLELLHAPYNYIAELYEIPEKLMQKIALVNLCDMALTQLRDSNGEIDYASLAENSHSVLLSILYNFI